jgi:hypothetical protein
MTAAPARRINDADGRRCAVDLLAQAIGRARPLLVEGTTKQRIRLLWAAVKHTRDLGASDVIHDAFMALAIEVELIDAHGCWVDEDLCRFGRDDVSHVIQWAMRGVNPFEEGPLR